MSLKSQLRQMMAENSQQMARQSAPPSDPWDDMAFWEKGLDLLGRPGYATSGAAKALLTGQDPLTAAIRGFTGKDRVTGSDLLSVAGMDPGIARGVAGFAWDVISDPLTWVSFGAGEGAKATIGGVTRTLTKVGEAAHEATIAEKTAQAGRVLERGVKPQLLTPELQRIAETARVSGADMSAAARPVGVPREVTQARYQRLLGNYGMTSLAPELPQSATAKLIGEVAGGKMLGRAIEGKAVPAVADQALQGARGAAAVTKQPTLRFAGQAIIPPQVVSGAVQGVKKAYTAAETLPVVGKALQVVRQSGQTLKSALAKAFSTSTGLPELDQILKRHADLLDSKTMSTVRGYVEKYVKPLAEMKKGDPAKYQKALSHIQTYLEGITDVVVKNVPNEFKAAQIERQVSRLDQVLQKVHAEHGAAKEASVMDILGQTIAREGKAKGIASQENKLARESHRMNEGKLAKELRARGIRMNEGFSKTEFEANIPKSMRKRSGVPMDTMIQELQRRGHLMHNATESDLYDLIKKITNPPTKITAEDVAAKLPAVKGSPVSEIHVKKIAALEAKLVEKKAALAAVPTVPVKVSQKLLGEAAVQRKFGEAIDPKVRAMAESMRQTFDAIWEAERKHLPLPPDKRMGYMPHYLKDEFRDTLVDIVRSDSRKAVKPEYTGKMNEAQRRTWETTVDKATIDKLVEGGHFDPSKVDALLKGRGLNPTADDLLVFETNPVQAALKRDLSSVRALSAQQMAQEVLESPQFTKARVALGDRDTILSTLAEHPGHGLFVPTKSYIDNFLSAGERESLRHGANAPLVGSLMKEISPAELREIAKNPLRAGTPAYIVPKEVSEVLAKAYSFQFDEKAFRDAANLWDKATAWWKMSVTAPWPQFHVRNGISNLWQMMVAGVRDPRGLYTAGLMMKDPALVGRVGRFTGEEAMALADKYGVLRSGFVTSDINDLIKREIAPSKNLLSTTGPIARLGTKVGGTIEDHARLALFIDGLEHGQDAASAAMRVKKYLFDYKDLTKTERALFRRVIPFYTWSRKSIPLAIETMLTKPGIPAAINKIRNEAKANVEDPLKDEYVSKFIKEGLGIPVKKNTDGSTSFFLLNGWIPTLDIMKLDPQDIFSSLHPAIKETIEQAINKDVFTGRPVEKFSGELTQFGGVTMPARLAHFLRNVSFFQKADRISNDTQTPISEKLLALGTGVKTYRQDKVIQMRGRVYELQDLMGKLHGAVELAKKKYGGDSAISMQAAEQLEQVTLERDRVKGDLLTIEPTALAHKAPENPKERPMSAMQTLQHLQRQANPKEMLNKTLHAALHPKGGH